MPSEQAAWFKQGVVPHSSTSTSQPVPVKPAGHWHSKAPGPDWTQVPPLLHVVEVQVGINVSQVGPS
jgi:hypothetical protein